MSVEQEPARIESTDHSSPGIGSPLPASTRCRGTLSAERPFKEVIVPMTVRIEVPEEHSDSSRSSPFLNRLLRTSSVLDDAAKKEWADDVEFRLLKIVKTLGLNGACYDVERSGNSVLICTVSPVELTKQLIASRSVGRWPGWDEILNAVPEFSDSIVEFDALQRWEWCRLWDIEEDEPRAGD